MADANRNGSCFILGVLVQRNSVQEGSWTKMLCKLDVIMIIFVICDWQQVEILPRALETTSTLVDSLNNGDYNTFFLKFQDLKPRETLKIENLGTYIV